MEEHKEGITSKVTTEKADEVATPKQRKPRVRKSTEGVELTNKIPVVEENQLEPFLEEESSFIELDPKKRQEKEKKQQKRKKEKESKKRKSKGKKSQERKSKKSQS